MSETWFIKPRPSESASGCRRPDQLRPFGRAADWMALPLGDVAVIFRETPLFCCPASEEIISRCHLSVIFNVNNAVYIGDRETGEARYPWIDQSLCGLGGNELLKQRTVIPILVHLERYAFKSPRNIEAALNSGWVANRSTYVFEGEAALRRLREAQPGKVRLRLYCGLHGLVLARFESPLFSHAGEIEDSSNLDVGALSMLVILWMRAERMFKAIKHLVLGEAEAVSVVRAATEVALSNIHGFWARVTNGSSELPDRLVGVTGFRQRFAKSGRKRALTTHSVGSWASRRIGLLADIMSGRPTVSIRTAVGATVPGLRCV